MRATQLGVVAVLASLSQAFLVLPEIFDTDTDIVKTLSFEDAIAADGRIVGIECYGCPIAMDREIKTQDSILQLNFSIAHGDTDAFMINGQQLYPIDTRSTAFLVPLTASQMIKKSDNTWETVSTPTLGYSVSVKHPVTFSNNDQIELLEIHFEIVEVANEFLSGIPTVEIKLLETSSGKLMIGDASILAPKTPSAELTDDGQECTTLLCKWRSVFAARLSQLKTACGSKTAASNSEVSKPHVYPDRPGHKRPHSPRPHGSHRPWRHHHRHNGFFRFLRGIVLHVFIPVLVGVTVGITASLVGMVVGHMVIFFWRLLFRRNRVQYTVIQQEIATDDEQIKTFLEPQGPPPQYDEGLVNEKNAE